MRTYTPRTYLRPNDIHSGEVVSRSRVKSVGGDAQSEEVGVARQARVMFGTKVGGTSSSLDSVTIAASQSPVQLRAPSLSRGDHMKARAQICDISVH